MESCSVVDVFCGVGGLTHGFIKEQFNVVAGLDIDASCRYPYEQNNKARFICKKIEEVTAQEILELFQGVRIKVLVGCAPCQPFSLYKKKYGTKDEKWKLVEAFADLITEVQPEVVSMENVPELLKFNKGAVFNNFVQRLSNFGYFVSPYSVYCPDYGIPQKRTRLVVFASKFAYVNLIEKTHAPEQYKTVRDTIEHLPPIEAGMTCMNDPLHKAMGMLELNLKRIKQSLPNGNWKDWDEELRAACHRRESGTHYKSVYGRMSWDEPAPTLTTECYAFGSGRFGHPIQDRAISLREAALLQTFPFDYVFSEREKELYFKTVGRHIGNAVPVDLGRVIARSIANHLEEQNGNNTRRKPSIQDVYQLECPESSRNRAVQ